MSDAIVDNCSTGIHTVFLGGGYYIYAMQYAFQEADIIYPMHCAVFLGGGYHVYYAIRSILGVRY